MRNCLSIHDRESLGKVAIEVQEKQGQQMRSPPHHVEDTHCISHFMVHCKTSPLVAAEKK